MPRSKPTQVTERRMTLGTWERELEETRVTGQLIRNVGQGIGAALLPVSLAASAVLGGIFFRDNIDEAIQQVTNWLDPNTGDAGPLIDDSMMTPKEEGEPAPFGKYVAAKVAQKDAREAAFNLVHESGVEANAALWAAWKEANPLVRVVSQDEGVYQISIRATAGRRYWAQFVPLGGQVAALVGMAMPGTYYTSATEADGFIDDPLIDLLAVRTIDTTYRRRTTDGANRGRAIEHALNMPWAPTI